VRSSDQRYFHVQRTKRPTEQYGDQIVHARQTARTTGTTEQLDAVIRESAVEHPVVLLACGRTANDFRRQFRRGTPAYHGVAANDVAPIDLLRDEKLDGYVVMRLTREQHRAVRDKAEKLYGRDRLLSDPQGAIWTQVVHASLAGEREEHIDLLANLRDRGRVLNEQDRQGYQVVPFPTPDELPDDLPANEAVLPFAAHQFLTWQGHKDAIRWEAWRSGMTTPVLMLTAYLEGRSMMEARYCRTGQRDTHEHRRHFQGQVDRIAGLGSKLDEWAGKWDGRRPEQVLP